MELVSYPPLCGLIYDLAALCCVAPHADKCADRLAGYLDRFTLNREPGRRDSEGRELARRATCGLSRKDHREDCQREHGGRDLGNRELARSETRETSRHEAPESRIRRQYNDRRRRYEDRPASEHQRHRAHKQSSVQRERSLNRLSHGDGPSRYHPPPFKYHPYGQEESDRGAGSPGGLDGKHPRIEELSDDYEDESRHELRRSNRGNQERSHDPHRNRRSRYESSQGVHEYEPERGRRVARDRREESHTSHEEVRQRDVERKRQEEYEEESWHRFLQDKEKERRHQRHPHEHSRTHRSEPFDATSGGQDYQVDLHVSVSADWCPVHGFDTWRCR